MPITSPTKLYAVLPLTRGAEHVRNVMPLDAVEIAHPHAKPEIEKYGYCIPPYAHLEEVHPIAYFRINGKRYVSLEKAAEENLHWDAVAVCIKTMPDNRKIFSAERTLSFFAKVRRDVIGRLTEKERDLRLQADFLAIKVKEMTEGLVQDQK